MAFTGTHHTQMSVTSGYWSGAKGSEVLLIDSAGNVGSGRVNTNAIVNEAVTTAKIADANVTTAKIADANVTTAKIASGAITTAKIAPDTVTLAQIYTGAFDYGTIGASGHTASWSTSISTVATVNVTHYGPLATGNSGMTLTASYSGHTINVFKYAVDGSAATSSIVMWQAWGT